MALSDKVARRQEDIVQRRITKNRKKLRRARNKKQPTIPLYTPDSNPPDDATDGQVARDAEDLDSLWIYQAEENGFGDDAWHRIGGPLPPLAFNRSTEITWGGSSSDTGFSDFVEDHSGLTGTFVYESTPTYELPGGTVNIGGVDRHPFFKILREGGYVVDLHITTPLGLQLVNVYFAYRGDADGGPEYDVGTDAFWNSTFRGDIDVYQGASHFSVEPHRVQTGKTGLDLTFDNGVSLGDVGLVTAERNPSWSARYAFSITDIPAYVMCRGWTTFSESDLPHFDDPVAENPPLFANAVIIREAATDLPPFPI